MSGIVGSKLNIRGSGTVAKLGTDGQHLLSSGAGKSANYETVAAAAYDDDKIQSNIALLGFKFATQNSLTKYNLQDQIIEEFEDFTGIDAGNSTNEVHVSGGYLGGTLPTVTQDADEVELDGNYIWYKWTDTGSTGSYSSALTADHRWFVLGGGGAGGSGGSTSSYAGGGGGAGGYRHGTAISLTGGNTYTVTVGVGGTAVAAGADAPGGDGGDSIISGTGITTITSTGGGGGGTRQATDETGSDGGSGGGGARNAAGGSATAITQYTAAGETTSVQGYDGGDGNSTGAASGGSASGAGTDGTGLNGVDGISGVSNNVTGTDVTYGGSGASGGGDGGTPGAGGTGGGGNGGNPALNDATAGTDGLGAGGGGGGATSAGGDGGNGVVILRRVSDVTYGDDLTLQSTANTASSAATKADLIMLVENIEGTATINTDIKGYVTADGGSNWTEGTLVDEGSYDASKKIYAFHDATVTSGTDLRYKITTHNQSEDSKETKIHAISLGWKA